MKVKHVIFLQPITMLILAICIFSLTMEIKSMHIVSKSMVEKDW